MSDKKIVFLDVDGTIVTYDNVLPASTRPSPRARAAAWVSRARSRRVM